MTRRYATPVDGRTVAIRRAAADEQERESGEGVDPALTPLRVLPSETPEMAQVVLALPPAAPALGPREAAALRAYFSWEEAPTFWWRTQRPATFRVRRLTPTIEVGYLEEPGLVLPAGDDPKHRPESEVPHVFGVYRRRQPGAPIVDPWGPQLVRDTAGAVQAVFESETSRAWLARFPGLGPEVVWLRLLRRDGERAAEVAAIRDEVRALGAISRARAGAVLEPLHAGALDTERYRGPYAALRPPLGVPPAELAAEARAIALDLAETMAASHRLGWFLGLLSPSLLRVRPAPDGRVRVTLVALPAAGRGGTLAGAVARMPTADAAYLERHPSLADVTRDASQDLRSLGYLLGYLLERGAAGRHALRDLASALVSGGIESADVAAHALARHVE